MISKRKVQSIAGLAIGGLLGFPTASGNLAETWARSTQPAATALAQPACAPERQAVCCEGQSKGQLVPPANHNEQTSPEQSGKKPNIPFILGDNIGYGDIGPI
jgi:hypothetical protein